MDTIIQFFKNIFGTLFGWWDSGINSIIDWVLDLLNGLFGSLGDFIGGWLASSGLVIVIPDAVFDVLDEITYGIGYFLPIAKLLPIVYFLLGFYILKVIFAVYSLIASTVLRRVNIKL